MILKKFNLKLLYLSLISLILLLGLGFSIFYYVKKSEYNNTLYEKAIFSNIKYPKEQQKALEILNSKAHFDELYRNIHSDYNRITKEGIILQYKVLLKELYIAKIDLNNDKILDVIVLVKNKAYQGSIFYTVIFYIVDSKDNWRKVSEGLADEHIIIFKQTHNGYRDIGFVSLTPYRDFDAGKTIYSYNGKEYDDDDFERQPLTQKDKEVFK